MSKKHDIPLPPPPQLYIITRPITDAQKALAELEPILQAAPVAAVLVKLAVEDTRAATVLLKAITPAIQAMGAAVLVHGFADCVARAGADGAHISMAAENAAMRFSDAHDSLAPERIVGVGDLSGTDDAMSLAEKGADYVMFGEPFISRKTEKNNTLPPLDAVIARVGWWAEVFEIPVVAYAPNLESVKRFCGVNADFIALDNALWDAPEGPIVAVKSIVEDLKRPVLT